MAHLKSNSLLLNQIVCSCKISSAAVRRLSVGFTSLLGTEAVGSPSMRMALWQEQGYSSLLPVFCYFQSTGLLKTFIQVYNCLVFSGILLKAAAKGHLLKGSDTAGPCGSFPASAVVTGQWLFLADLPPWDQTLPYHTKLSLCWWGSTWAKLRQNPLTCRHGCNGVGVILGRGNH